MLKSQICDGKICDPRSKGTDGDLLQRGTYLSHQEENHFYALLFKLEEVYKRQLSLLGG